MNRFLPTLLLVIVSFFLGVAVLSWYTAYRNDQAVREEATVLLERVRNVTKLVTVEGDVSELFSSTASRNVTLYLPLPTRFSFDKKATVEVRGTILVGYDLEQLELRIDPEARTLTVANMPAPEILAIDHELIYRDLEESWFNTFTARDYSRLNRRAKERLREQALESELMARAQVQGLAVIESIEYLVRGAGYRLVVEPTPTSSAGSQ
jgi:hypothetical protein